MTAMLMRISANNDYLDGDIQVGDVVLARPYSVEDAPELKYEFLHPCEPNHWLCCEERELVPYEETDGQIDALAEKYASKLAVCEGALLIAAIAFEMYAQNHFAKLTPEATIKGIQNSGLAKLMHYALEAD